MSRVLPILFNTDMVRAILDGRKTVTRRAVKYKYSNTEMKMHTDKYGTRVIEIQKDIEGETHGRRTDGSTWRKILPFIEKVPPYKRGDILYVRETFCYHEYAREPWYGYKADGDYRDVDMRWTPSIHMPKEAARIFLKVKDVRVERLQEITEEQAKAEGICGEWAMAWWKPTYYDPDSGGYPKYRDTFAFDLWDSTIKKADLYLYGWYANPYVWVIEFEQCKKPENF